MDQRAKVDRALVFKEEGNNAFRSGNYPAAIKAYYNVVTLLKGLNTGNLPVPTSFKPKVATTQATITELPDDAAGGEKPENEDEESQQGSQAEADEAASEADDEKYSSDAIKKTLAQCYTNMATCHAKKENWSACKRNAAEALKEDPANTKAAFRQAQAYVRLGEITKGRQLLVELKGKSDDPAVANELKILDAAEKSRDEKHKNAFRGFIAKSNSSPGPKIQEITDDVAGKPVVAT